MVLANKNAFLPPERVTIIVDLGEGRGSVALVTSGMESVNIGTSQNHEGDLPPYIYGKAVTAVPTVTTDVKVNIDKATKVSQTTLSGQYASFSAFLTGQIALLGEKYTDLERQDEFMTEVKQLLEQYL